MADSSYVIECRDLVIERRSRGEKLRAIDGVSFNLGVGQTLGVTGPAGSGKSTLLALMAGSIDQLYLRGGEVKICGTQILARGRAGRIRQARTGWVPQGAGATLPAGLSVREYIIGEYGRGSRKLNIAATDVRVATLLDELGLPIGTGEKFPFELSAGMRQRVVIAQALMWEPRLLVADEILVNLDEDVVPIVLSALRRRQEQNGLALLLGANHPEIFEYFRAEMRVLREGFVVATGSFGALQWTPGAQDEPAG